MKRDLLPFVLGIPLVVGLFLPFAAMRPNRIAAATDIPLFEAVGWAGVGLYVVILIALMAMTSTAYRGICAVLALLLWVWSLGLYADIGVTDRSPSARISPSSGFWLVSVALGLFVMDTLARFRPSAWARLAYLGAAGMVMAGFLHFGFLDNISILQEYTARQVVFWAEAQRHLLLAFGSFLIAMLLGVPLGIACHRKARAGNGVLSLLTLIQTIPSMALFGMLILPLGWIATHVPGARAIGVAGIGMAPAFVALVLYALLPIVANTVAGLRAVPASVSDAARGMGFSVGQRIRQVDFPLALPIILTGARIVLVQNIGLATVGALIGAGGFGTFVFQGLGQTAPDLILLGALPTVVLALAASIVMGAVIELTGGTP